MMFIDAAPISFVAEIWTGGHDYANPTLPVAIAVDHSWENSVSDSTEGRAGRPVLLTSRS